MGADTLSLSAHKFGGPQGIGALFIASDLPWALRARSFGVGQEGGLRSGTVPAPLCAAFGAAAEYQFTSGDRQREIMASMKQEVIERLMASISELRLTVSHMQVHPGCLSIFIPGVKGADIAQVVSPEVSIGHGSACNSLSIERSHVIASLGIENSIEDEPIRISFSEFSTE
ncbi:MAG: hypothetical protein CFE32_24975, partial [Alphaproteobacteria bacterium PA3]